MISNDGRRCIFIVEDSKEIRDLIQLLFNTEGYAVEFACDGKTLLKSCAPAKSLQA